MKQKLLDDAQVSGFCVVDEVIYADEWNGIVLDKNKLDKFAELQIPDGYKLVPIEDTEYMNDMGFKAYQQYSNGNSTFQVMISQIYKAMLAVSPPINAEG